MTGTLPGKAAMTGEQEAALAPVFAAFDDLRDSLRGIAYSAQDDLDQLVESIREAERSIIGTHYRLLPEHMQVVREALRAAEPKGGHWIDPAQLADLLEGKVIWAVPS